jgi:hypothetical protein
MRVEESAISACLNKKDLFLFHSCSELEPETNALRLESVFSMTLYERVSENIGVILGNKIFQNSRKISENSFIFNICTERIDDYFVGAFQVRYGYKKKLFEHLAWQSTQILRFNVENKDITVHLEYPALQRYPDVDDMLGKLPKNVIVHVPSREK